MFMCHRVTTPFVAVSGENGSYRAVTLEPGDSIEVRSENITVRSGIVKIVYDGLVLSAYLRDIEDRTEEVEPN